MIKFKVNTKIVRAMADLAYEDHQSRFLEYVRFERKNNRLSIMSSNGHVLGIYSTEEEGEDFVTFISAKTLKKITKISKKFDDTIFTIENDIVRGSTQGELIAEHKYPTEINEYFPYKLMLKMVKDFPIENSSVYHRPILSVEITNYFDGLIKSIDNQILFYGQKDDMSKACLVRFKDYDNFVGLIMPVYLKDFPEQSPPFPDWINEI